MLEQRLDVTEPAWQPAVAPALRRSELLGVVALRFLFPALAILAFVLYPLFSALWIGFHHKMVGVPARSFGELPEAVR